MKRHLILILTQLFLILSFNVHAQLASVSGFVKNRLTGEAIQDATVFESISEVGTITNNDGFFRLLLIPEEQKLEISSPDYKPHTSAFNLVADTVIIVELAPLNLSNTKSEEGNKYQVEPFASSDTNKTEVKTMK